MQRHKPINQKNISVNTHELFANLNRDVACTSVGCQTVEPNDPTQQPHTFNSKLNSYEYHIIYIIEGDGDYITKDGISSQIKKGDIMLVRPGEGYTYSASRNNGWTMYWISFFGEEFEDLINKLDVFESHIPLSMGVNATLEGILNGMIMVSVDKKRGSDHLLVSSIYTVLALANFKVLNYNERQNPVIGRIHEAREILRNDIKAQISPETVAERVGISYSLFRRMFKGYMGVSPVQFQMDVRHKRAEELLSTTDYSIATIAEILGFTDTAQFSTFFHKRQGITARDYRKMYK